LDNARAVFGKAVQVNFRQVQQLASVYMEWAEMEIRNQHFERALDVMRRATSMFLFNCFYLFIFCK
jgi:pre-mRNA-splicing factor SYF1